MHNQKSFYVQIHILLDKHKIIKYIMNSQKKKIRHRLTFGDILEKK